MGGANYRLPKVPRSQDAAFNEWGGEVVRALDALRRDVNRDLRGVTWGQVSNAVAGAEYVHPFKMSVDLSKNPVELSVAYGQASMAELSGQAGTGDLWCAKNSELVDLAGQPLTYTPGAPKEWGVWVSCYWSTVEVGYNFDYRGVVGKELSSYQINIEEVNVDPTDYANMNSGSIGAQYIGHLEKDASDTWTITQHLRSDVTFVAPTWPIDFISGAPDGAPNRLTQSSNDGRLQVIHADDTTRDTGAQ